MYTKSMHREMKKRWNFMAMRPLLAVLFLIVMGFLILRTADQQLISRVSHQSNTSTLEDRSHGGFHSLNSNKHSCISRNQSLLHRKTFPLHSSTYLASKLKSYEELHKRCAPNTPLFNKAVAQLRTSNSTGQLECNYIIWTPLGGLGNRMLTLASTFLYAVLTDRVLLIDHATDFVDLFCEPFPDSSWVLPPNFPIEGLDGYDAGSEKSYAYLIKNNLISEDIKARPEMLPGFVYVHLESTYVWDVRHQFFFCDDTQVMLSKINWLLVRSDNYFLPGLYMLCKFEKDLAQMFPSRETVFHHLSQYLFHPSNSVWKLVVKYYQSYVATANQVVGIQIRDFPWSLMSKEDRFNQIMYCTLNENILPAVRKDNHRTGNLTTDEVGSKSILVISLHKEYYDRIKRYYAESTNFNHPIDVYQPTHEEAQQLKNTSHNEKALAEIFLLSYSDVLVTSAWSTFGYVSYNLAGIKPLILLSSKVSKEVDPPCVQVKTLDPCFHTPPMIDCKTKRSSKTKLTGPYLQQCEDVDEGIKLVD